MPVMIADSWEKLLKSAEFFHLDKEKFSKLKKFFESLDLTFFRRIASYKFGEFPENEVKSLFPADDQYRLLLLVVVANGENLKELYRKNNFPAWMLELISFDLSIWMRAMEADLGFYGLTWEIFAWQRHCLFGKIKQFGRLQCNEVHLFNVKRSFYRDADGVLQSVAGQSMLPADAAVALNYQEPCINLHIPASGPLLRKDCIAAIKNMVEFYREFYPEYRYRAVVCYSWLLSRQFRELLPPESNIIQFQDLGHNFDIPEIDQDNSIRWRLWDAAAKEKNADELICRTSLQRKVVEFWKGGGHFIEGGLIIFPDELPALFRELD